MLMRNHKSQVAQILKYNKRLLSIFFPQKWAVLKFLLFSYFTSAIWFLMIFIPQQVNIIEISFDELSTLEVICSLAIWLV